MGKGVLVLQTIVFLATGAAKLAIGDMYFVINYDKKRNHLAIQFI